MTFKLNRFSGVLKNSGEEGLEYEDGESRFFATPQDPDERQLEESRWNMRALNINAQAIDRDKAIARLRNLWRDDDMMQALGDEAIDRLAPFIDLVSVPADQEIIVQDEHSDFMFVLLQGSISVLRKQEWGDVMVLATVAPGEMLGEMSLIDAGERFSTCLTRFECDIAVITAHHLEQMILSEPAAAARLILLLARKLSLRLRVVSARLGGRKT